MPFPPAYPNSSWTSSTFTILTTTSQARLLEAGSPQPYVLPDGGADSEFEFALVPITCNGDGCRDKDKGQRLLEKGTQILIEALNSLGVGFKTAISYGRFKPSDRGNTQEDKAIASTTTSPPQGRGIDTNAIGTAKQAPQSNIVDPKIQTLQMMIDSLRPRDMGRWPNTLDNIASASSDPSIRKKLADRLYRKLFPNPAGSQGTKRGPGTRSCRA